MSRPKTVVSLDQYEKQLTDSLLSKVPHPLLELAEKAQASGFLSHETQVIVQWNHLLDLLDDYVMIS